MPKLKPNEFSSVSALFKGVKYYAPVAYSVIEENQPGAIFVDNNINPTVALVCGQSGFCYLARNQDNERFNQSLPTLLFEEVGLGFFKLTPMGEEHSSRPFVLACALRASRKGD